MSATSFGGAETMTVSAAVKPDNVTEESPERSRLYAFGKRAIDLVLGTVAFIFVLPVLAVAAVAIRVTSPGPIFFRQERIGLDGKTFTMWKFRTMYTGTDDAAHRAYVRSMFGQDEGEHECGSDLHKLNDARVTPAGRWLRPTSIDELPQLVNVLRGQMSLVGPRPALPWEVELFAPYERLRAQVKPGITGLWQVSGRSRLTMREALELDCVYAQDPGLLLDFKILLKTIPVVLFRREAA